MTILESISEIAETLPPDKQKNVLHYVKSLQVTKRPSKAGRVVAKKAKIDRSRLHPALRAVAGMWKDRTDLPKDSIAASKILRRRVMGRSSHV